MDTNDNPQVVIQGLITRARARQLNLEVSSFLSNSFCEFENRLLPNDLIILRNEGEDLQVHGRPDQDGDPNRSEFFSVSDSKNSPH